MEFPKVMTDAEMIDWLESYVNAHKALVLHIGNQDVGKYSGLGIRPGSAQRTLREAITQCAGRAEAADTVLTGK